MKQYKYKTVIFDMDGTILNTLEDLTDAVNYVMQRFGMPMHSIAAVKGFVGNGIRVLLERAVPGGEKHPDFEAVLSAFKEYYGKHCNDKTCAYEGIKPLMKKLKDEGLQVAIVSNKVHSAVLDLCREYFEGLSDVAIGDQPGLARKPAPDMVFEAMKILDAKKETTVYVGDSEVDFATACNSGLDCISVLWGFRTKEQLLEAGATVFADSPDDVLKLIAE